jgi:sigma-B regulation protein RsbQ
MSSRTMWDTLGATRVGTGNRTIVLANGLGTSQDTWRYVVSAFASRAQIVRFDPVGMSPDTTDAFDVTRHDSLYGYADDVMAMLDDVGLRRVLYIGHSVGGMIGLIAAAAAPDVIDRLVTIGASCSYLDRDDYEGGFSEEAMEGILAAAQSDFRSWAAGFAPLAVGPEGTAEGVEEFTNYLRRMRPDVGLRTLRTIMLGDYRAVPARVQQTVTVLQPTQDIVVPWTAAEYLASQLPNGELVAMQARGHVPQLTAAAELIDQLRRVIDPWLAP